MCDSKLTLGGPNNYRTLCSSSKFEELKNTLKHKCRTVSGSRLFHRFSMSARSGSTRYHNALPNKISSGRISKYIDGLLHSVFADSLNSSQGKDSDAQTLTIHYFFAEICPVLIDWWRVQAILLLC